MKNNTRDELYLMLKKKSPDLAIGKTRAKREVLLKLLERPAFGAGLPPMAQCKPLKKLTPAGRKAVLKLLDRHPFRAETLKPFQAAAGLEEKPVGQKLLAFPDHPTPEQRAVKLIERWDTPQMQGVQGPEPFTPRQQLEMTVAGLAMIDTAGLLIGRSGLSIKQLSHLVHVTLWDVDVDTIQKVVVALRDLKYELMEKSA